MAYIINSKYRFCGWDGLPFALVGADLPKPQFLTKEEFGLLWRCDGFSEVDRDSLVDDLAGFFDWVLANGIVQEADEDSGFQMHDYTLYPCRYRQEVQLSITGKCNYRCKHCFQSAPHGVLGEPTVEEVCAELDQLAECGVFRVSITGGEPLIHESLWDIIDHIKELGLHLTTMYSNGKLVDQELLDGFKKRDLRPAWQISFDGLGTHDWLRGVEGAEEAAVEAIKLLVANGFPVSAAYTLTRRTAPVFRETMSFLASIGVHSVKSGCTQAQGEWLDQSEEWLTDEEYLEFYKEYIPHYIGDGRPLSLQFEGLFNGTSDEALAMSEAERAALREAEDDRGAKVAKGTAGVMDKAASESVEIPPYAFMTQAEFTEDEFGQLLSCGVLGTSFYIGPTGRVLPCMGMDGTPIAEEFDTLRDRPLREILSVGSRFIEATGYTMKDVFDHNSECSDCEHRAHCGSGCRQQAICFHEKDYLGLDDRTCKICKEDWAGKIHAVMVTAMVGDDEVDGQS